MSEQPQNKTVLIVEDEEHIAFILKFLLEREGYSPVMAADGQIAHDMISEIAPPKLVLLDIMLPYIDGNDLIKLIRSQEHWKTVPVIMLSAKLQENDIVQALEAGANDYVVKPFQPMELLARIKRHL